MIYGENPIQAGNPEAAVCADCMQKDRRIASLESTVQRKVNDMTAVGKRLWADTQSCIDEGYTEVTFTVEDMRALVDLLGISTDIRVRVTATFEAILDVPYGTDPDYLIESFSVDCEHDMLHFGFSDETVEPE